MYIENKYWNNYIGDTDDSLALIEYLADKRAPKISLTEIFSDIGLDKLQGNFRQNEEPLMVVLKNVESDYDEPHIAFSCAIDLIMDLAALLLECKINGSVDLNELVGYEMETDVPIVCITATEQEHQLIHKALADFVSEPMVYDSSELCSEEELAEIAALCENLRKELYE